MALDERKTPCLATISLARISCCAYVSCHSRALQMPLETLQSDRELFFFSFFSFSSWEFVFAYVKHKTEFRRSLSISHFRHVFNLMHGYFSLWLVASWPEHRWQIWKSFFNHRCCVHECLFVCGSGLIDNVVYHFSTGRDFSIASTRICSIFPAPFPSHKTANFKRKMNVRRARNMEKKSSRSSAISSFWFGCVCQPFDFLLSYVRRMQMRRRTWKMKFLLYVIW